MKRINVVIRDENEELLDNFQKEHDFNLDDAINTIINSFLKNKELK